MNKRNLFWLLPLLLCLFPQKVMAETIYKNEEEAVYQETSKLEEKPGTYPVTIKYRQENEIFEKKVNITITGEHTSVFGTIAIDAADVVVYEDEVLNMVKSDWILLAQAKAWRTDNGEVLTVTDVDDSQVRANSGTYPLTFKTVDQVTTTVQATVKKGTRSEIESQLTNYQKNQLVENYEEKLNQHSLSWDHFENKFVVFIQWILLGLLFVPLIVLIVQYLFTRNLTKQVISILLEKDK